MIEQIKEKLRCEIDEPRFEHSLRVMEEAKKLARYYHVDVEKATIAGLLHDCGRFKDKAYLLKKACEFDIILDKVYAKNVNLIHSGLGAKLAKYEYGIKDKDILNAIKYHTTGRENMSILEKIVYMSDYTEPLRDFEGIDEIRELCYKDINQALIEAINNTIKYILNSKSIIHEDTIKARNFLLFNI